jgi:Tat protein secretion system quality control protein TatD with DNase activity
MSHYHKDIFHSMNTLQFFDTHAHLCSSQFDDDRYQVLQRMQAARAMRHLEIAYSLESARRVVEFATADHQRWAVVVQPNHPEDAFAP